MPSAPNLRAELAAEFRRRGMLDHAALVRGWADGFVLEWARTLRIPPNESFYEVRPGASACCRGYNGIIAKCSWPGGARFQCWHCKREWLVLDG
jgi:hypothetical protein